MLSHALASPFGRGAPAGGGEGFVSSFECCYRVGGISIGSFARLRRAQGLSALGGGHKCPPEPPAPMTSSNRRFLLFEGFSLGKIESACRIIWSSAYLALPLLLQPYFLRLFGDFAFCGKRLVGFAPETPTALKGRRTFHVCSFESEC